MWGSKDNSAKYKMDLIASIATDVPSRCTVDHTTKEKKPLNITKGKKPLKKMGKGRYHDGVKSRPKGRWNTYPSKGCGYLNLKSGFGHRKVPYPENRY